MEINLQVTLGDETFTLAHVTVQEMAKVKQWTGHKNRDAWYEAIREEDPEALIAAYCLVKQRKDEPVRFTDADFDLDTLDATLVDVEGREVEPLVQRDDDENVRLDDKGVPIPVLDERGRAQWLYVDTQEPVPPTQTASTVTSLTPKKRGSGSESASQTPTSAAG